MTNPPFDRSDPFDPNRQAGDARVHRTGSGEADVPPSPTSGRSVPRSSSPGLSMPPEPPVVELRPTDSIMELGDEFVAHAPGESDDGKAGGFLSFLYELPILIFVALVVAVIIKTFLIQAFFIPSGSMIPTLEVGDRVLVNKLAYAFSEPQAGDVVVFESPFAGSEDDDESIVEIVTRNIAEALGMRTAGAEDDLIKRIVGVEGDTVEVIDNLVLVNGRVMAEPYRANEGTMPDFDPVVIPEGHVFVMGDNRGRSQDSRRFGAIPVDDIIGRAFSRVWPVERWGGL